MRLGVVGVSFIFESPEVTTMNETLKKFAKKTFTVHVLHCAGNVVMANTHPAHPFLPASYDICFSCNNGFDGILRLLIFVHEALKTYGVI